MTKGERTKNSIIEASAAVFNQRGFEGSSLNALMDATGLKKGGIYRHFASKEELAAEAFDYTWKAAWDARMAGVDEQPNGIERIRRLIANFVDFRSPVAGGCPILNTAVDADDGSPVLRARVTKALRFWVARLQAFVELAKEQGAARPGIDAHSVATVVISSLEGALMISRLQRSIEPLKEVQRHLNRYLDAEVAMSTETDGRSTSRVNAKRMRSASSGGDAR